MSEELLQTAPQIIGKYTYYKLGNTTLNQLKANGLIPKRNYNQIGSKKPDGLVLYHNTVMAVIEYKTPANLQSDQAVQKAIKQEINVAKALCKILIITDGIKSYWVNALNGEFIGLAEKGTTKLPSGLKRPKRAPYCRRMNPTCAEVI